MNGLNLVKTGHTQNLKLMHRILILLFLLSSFVPSIRATDRYPLDNSIDVTHYCFSIWLSDSYDMIKGEAQIRIMHRGMTEQIELDLVSVRENGTGMVVEQVMLDEQDTRWSHEGDRLIIIPGERKNNGETSRISIKYYGQPADGLIISKNRFGDRTFFADNWPDRARNWIPCIDHPSDKATVEFIVYTPIHYSVVSNGYLYEESILPEGIKLTHWKEETSISTKVMVIGVARFAKQLAGIAGGTEIWSWVFPEDRERGFLDYSVAIKPFSYFSETIGAYAYEKLANVQSKTIFGGMENAGCIFYSENSVTGREEAERLMAHEIAHQWFGNSVTEGNWHHIWLSEGFATYFAACYTGYVYGDARLRAEMQHARTRVIAANDRMPAPLVDTTITNFMKLLNANSYQKGAWVLHMLRDEIGEADFDRGIKTYFSRYRNRTALSSDFENTMEEVSGRDLSLFFEQWLTRPGLPQLAVSWTYNPRRDEVTILVEQMQPGELYDFPLEFEVAYSGGSRSERFRITGKSQSFIVKTSGRVTSVNADPGVKLLYKLSD